MPNSFAEITLTIDKKTTKVYMRARDAPLINEKQVYCGATLLAVPVTKGVLPNGDITYKGQAALNGEKAEVAIVELNTLDFHEVKKKS